MKDKQIVHDILRDYPEARNSDKELMLIYEYKYWTNCWDVNKFIKEHYSFISNHNRYRRYWQNTKGLFPATDIVKQQREAYRKEVVEEIREEKKSLASNIYSYAKRIIRNK